MDELKKIGQACAEVRRAKGYTQLQVSFEIGYTPENVSAFECGRNDNMRILIWYLQNCVSISELRDFIRGLEINEYR